MKIKNNNIHNIVFLLLIYAQIHVDAAGLANLSQGDIDYYINTPLDALFGYSKPSVHSGLESYSTTASKITGTESSVLSQLSSYWQSQSNLSTPQTQNLPHQSAWSAFLNGPAQEIAHPQEEQTLLEWLGEQLQAWTDWIEGRATIQEPIYVQERPRTFTEWMVNSPAQIPVHARTNKSAFRQNQQPESPWLSTYNQILSQPNLSWLKPKDLTQSIDRSNAPEQWRTLLPVPKAPEQSAWPTLWPGQPQATQIYYPPQAQWSWASSQQVYGQPQTWQTFQTLAPRPETRTLLPANIYYTTWTGRPASGYQQSSFSQAPTQIAPISETVTLPPTSGLFDFLSSLNSSSSSGSGSNSSSRSKFDTGKPYSSDGESNDTPTLVII